MRTPLTRALTAIICLGLAGATASSQAAIITFDAVVSGATSFGFDGDGDGINDVIFSTTDPNGFNTVGPGPNMTYIDEPGLEGTSVLNPDLRVDFLNGAIGSLTFGFALDSPAENPAYFASIRVFDAGDNLTASGSEPGAFTITSPPSGLSSFPEGVVSVSFGGIASYATFDFTSEFGRYIMDNFEGTYGSTEDVTPAPEPTTLALVVLGLLGAGILRRRLA